MGFKHQQARVFAAVPLPVVPDGPQGRPVGRGRVRAPVTAPELSVVAPLFDEQDNVGPFLDEVWRTLRAFGRSFEIICVDDGSGDQTLPRLKAHLPCLPELRILALPARGGQSAALAAGIAASRGRLVALIDADLQNDPADLLAMVGALERDPTLAAVMGFRPVRQVGWLARAASALAHRLARLIVPGMAVRDAGCALKVVRGPLLRSVPSFRGMQDFLGPLVQRAGGRMCELPVGHRDRVRGRSKQRRGLGRALAALGDAFGMRWLCRRGLLVHFIEHREI